MDKIYKDMNLVVNETDDNFLTNIYRKIKLPKRKYRARISVHKPGNVYQSDILYLPNDNSYKYLLCVVDLNDNAYDCEPLKNRDTKTVKKAFQSIFSRRFIKMPMNEIQVDGGAEFKQEVTQYFNDHNVFVKRGVSGRHKQQGLIENFNKLVGTILMKKMAIDEIHTGETSRRWLDDIKPLVESMNKHLKEKNKRDFTHQEVLINTPQELIPLHTKVRVALNEPKSIADNAKLHGRFREGDHRWDIKPHEIESYILLPDQPPLYKVKTFEKNLFQKYELQEISTKEKIPPPRVYIIKELLDRYKEKGKIMYKIKWNNDEITSESRAHLMKEVPDLIKDYEKTH